MQYFIISCVFVQVGCITGLLTPGTGFTPQTSPAGSDDRLFNEKDADAERPEVSKKDNGNNYNKTSL